MALDQSALAEFLDTLRSGGDLDVMREAMQLVLQALIDLEATEKIGAGRYERNDDRTTPSPRWRGNLEPTRRAGPMRGCEHDSCCRPRDFWCPSAGTDVSADRKYELSVVRKTTRDPGPVAARSYPGAPGFPSGPRLPELS